MTAPSPSELLEEVPESQRGLFAELVELTDAFCAERLDDEYRDVCRLLAADLCHEGTPAARGKREGWACGVAYTAGWVNFLTDPASEPHLRADEIAEWFGVSEATMHAKARVLRDGLELTRLDPDYCVASRLATNPFVWLFEIGGVPVDVRYAPRDVQQAMFEAGLIPFVPETCDEEPPDEDAPDEEPPDEDGPPDAAKRRPR